MSDLRREHARLLRFARKRYQLIKLAPGQAIPAGARYLCLNYIYTPKKYED